MHQVMVWEAAGLGALCVLGGMAAADQQYGHERTIFAVNGHPAFVILPSRPAAGGIRPWVWYAPTFLNGYPNPSNEWLFRQLLEAGWTVGGVEVGESYGNPAGREVYSQFYDHVIQEYGLAARACLAPQSRGGLMLYNWAVENPWKVQCIAGIYPVCDLSSYPGLAPPAPAYGLTEQELAEHLAEHNPIDRLEPLAQAGVPIFHIHGDADSVVPLERNSQVLFDRYQALGGQMELVVVQGQGHAEIPEFFQSPALLQFLLAQTPNRYREAVRACLDHLLEYGADRYGAVQTPMLMSIMDVRTNESPPEPLLLDGRVRGEGRPGRRNPGGCDLWEDQPLLHALLRYGDLVGDPRYRSAAEAYIRSFFERARKPNGLLAWGSHLFYNAYTDKIDDDRHGNPHEILVHLAEWDAMWQVDPEIVRQEIEGIWQWHIVNQETGQHNRHDDAAPGCDFAFSGGSFAHAFAFLYCKTGDQTWLDRAKRVVNWHWSHRDPATNLVPDAPSTGDRYDATHCFTTVVGPHAAALLRCFEITADPFFQDVAVAYVKAWLKYAWDDPAGLFYAALRLDGTPTPEQAKGTGYDAWMPTGYADTWPTTMYSYEFPLAAAQTCVYAYELTADPELLEGARKWSRHIRASLPPTLGRRWREEIYAAVPEMKQQGGAYADGYGRAISFFVHLHRAMGDPEDLDTARLLADEALAKLGENGWLKGHAGKPYYEATDGVGTLLGALLELSDLRW